jgi:hypothetical protein
LRGSARAKSFVSHLLERAALRNAVPAGGLMDSRSEREEILAQAVAGIAQVAKNIAQLTADQQAAALGAVERSYRKTVDDLGYGAVPAQKWVTAVMTQLRMKVRGQKLSARTWFWTML